MLGGKKMFECDFLNNVGVSCLPVKGFGARAQFFRRDSLVHST